MPQYGRLSCWQGSGKPLRLQPVARTDVAPFRVFFPPVKRVTVLGLLAMTRGSAAFAFVRIPDALFSKPDSGAKPTAK